MINVIFVIKSELKKFYLKSINLVNLKVLVLYKLITKRNIIHYYWMLFSLTLLFLYIHKSRGLGGAVGKDNY